MPQTTDLRTINSLTYADVAGLPLGLPRLAGEATPAYVDRLYRATVAVRNHSYEGTLDALALAFGLDESLIGTITAADPDALIVLAPGMIRLGATTLYTAVMATDTYLVWKTLGEVFTEINAVAGFTAFLTGNPSAPAFQLARQGNVGVMINEDVAEPVHVCQQAGVIVESVRFNLPVPTWSMAEGRLTLTGAPPAGLQMSYQYQTRPCGIVASEVGLVSLADPALSAVAVSETNVLAYQVREFIQAVMKTDRSYWTK